MKRVELKEMSAGLLNRASMRARMDRTSKYAGTRQVAITPADRKLKKVASDHWTKRRRQESVFLSAALKKLRAKQQEA